MDEGEIRDHVYKIANSPLGLPERLDEFWQGAEEDGTNFAVYRHIIELNSVPTDMVGLSLSGSPEGVTRIVNDFCEALGTPGSDEEISGNRLLLWFTPRYPDQPIERPVNSDTT